ncbi:MAG: sigma-70 family RNA polymerase sigma factor [Sphingomonadales bacterium]|nr:sigma-70 family RNA polymerase sigma factor [Sphingomonadales bacterium]MDE2169412.1 sigma-70 family RNA polymerase sigma factor [Sphingomonadales bacterium]
MHIFRSTILRPIRRFLAFLVHRWWHLEQPEICEFLKSNATSARQSAHPSLADLPSPFSAGQIEPPAVPTRGKTPLEPRLARLHQAIEDLPEPGRSIFKDHCLDGLTYSEIARLRDMSIAQIQLEFADAMVALTAADIGRDDD